MPLDAEEKTDGRIVEMPHASERTENSLEYKKRREAAQAVHRAAADLNVAIVRAVDEGLDVEIEITIEGDEPNQREHVEATVTRSVVFVRDT